MNIKQKLSVAFAAVVLAPMAAMIFVNHSTMNQAIYGSYTKKAKADARRTIGFMRRDMVETASHYVRFLAQDTNLIQAAYYATTLGATQDLQTELPAFKKRLNLSFLQIKHLDGRMIYGTGGKGLAELPIREGSPGGALLTFDKSLGRFVIHSSAVIKRRDKPIALIDGGYILRAGLLKGFAADGIISLYGPAAKDFASSGPIKVDGTWVREAFDRETSACENDIDSEACRKEAFNVARKTMAGVPYLLVATPIRTTPAMPIGTLVVAQEATQMERDLANARHITILVSLGGIAASILLGFLLARSLSRPIVALKDAAIAMGKGNLNARVGIESKDELGVLAHAFNEMGQALSSTTVSRDYVENVLRSMADALVVLDARGCISRVNRAALKMLGYGEDELIGQRMEQLIEDQGFLPRVSRELAENGAVSDQETTYRAKDGGAICVSLSGALLHDMERHASGSVFVAQDITARKQAVEELERTNQQLDQFAYVVSHDLKAPLRAISNLSKWIEEDIADALTDGTRKQMNLLRGRVQRMEALINGILEYSRVGRVNYEVDTVDTQAMLSEIIDSMPLPEMMRIHIGPGMPTLRAARVPMSQVFSNLISNAIKYRERDDGRIDVSVRDAGAFYEFAVADDGPGIAPEYHEKIFGIFQTLAPRDEVESTGVGLSLVKKIVDEQGGSVTVESAEGQGATFRFTWPKHPK